ncbi:hypothetical protein MNR01_08490 [Lysobacter sp. S4-A87]|uniref:hypothetical protein n=1 Tax=Lysobacter sp. S4-A87 TaxID=2925843 RepID=UPI001F530422|nr:hypothetical protein [Lysobacter sp. S4-A87]UNK51015.1 hypothetical protein MNR01_08490 [Lysobacter sp. S4-A87]
MLAVALLLPLQAMSAEPATAPVIPAPMPSAPVPSAPVTSAPVPSAPMIPAPVAVAPQKAASLPPMKFLSSLAGDDVFTVLKAEPALSALDKELAGSPLSLIVTHTVRPTAGGTAAGLLSAVLSGSTLGIIPVVTNDRLVIRYEVLLNGKTVTSFTFERTATRAQNLWTMGTAGDDGLGKAGLEWLKTTAVDVAAKLPRDPAMLAVRDEIDFYFPPAPAKAVAGATP